MVRAFLRGIRGQGVGIWDMGFGVGSRWMVGCWVGQSSGGEGLRGGVAWRPLAPGPWWCWVAGMP